MTVKITFCCGGCHDEAPAILPHRTFNSVNGKGYGFGTYTTPVVEDVVPDGWVYPDPYTGTTYCPKCWAEIEAA